MRGSPARPSSRKNRLSAVSERKKTSDVSPSMPFATPSSSAWKELLVAELASCFAFSACARIDTEVLQPAGELVLGVRQLIADVAALACDARHDHDEDPHAERDDRRAAAARRPGRAGPGGAPARRPAGEATAAITPAAITGRTIVCVSERIQTAPTRNRRTPTSSHAVRPRSRSQPGAARASVRSGRLGLADLLLAAHGVLWAD